MGETATEGSALKDRATEILSYVQAIARKYGADGINDDDLVSAAMLTITRKFHMYDPAKAPLKVWVSTVAANAMRDELRSVARAAGRIESYVGGGDLREGVAGNADLLTVAEGIREKVKKLDGAKRRRGQHGLTDADKLAIAMLISHTEWTAERATEAIRRDDSLRKALGLTCQPGITAVNWCASICLLAAKFKQLIS